VAKRTGAESATETKRVTIRVPSVLHDALWRRREETGQSLNDLLIEAAAKLVGMPVPEVPKGIPGPKPKPRGR
jgi:predicted HicB family RNase H-like nuclease